MCVSLNSDVDVVRIWSHYLEENLPYLSLVYEFIALLVVFVHSVICVDCRLLSLRGERDLTLGALTLNSKKKNFCPVLPSQAKPKVKQE